MRSTEHLKPVFKSQWMGTDGVGRDQTGADRVGQEWKGMGRNGVERVGGDRSGWVGIGNFCSLLPV